ncbi:hypothetical protein PY365_23190 [Roseiarcaceae bacterium H3SJ34-1]|uniref:hypothetical protein n=1 Tax=Terripilifer ovatus TaxID=3032367 RepID=UPI003AB97E3C|nr:hypothetical protein [Roseiarcaceae bacterium H3SJ34-1]
MSTIKLDPSFNRQTKPSRVGGFQPPAVTAKPAAGIGRFLYMTAIAAIVGASIVLFYHWLLNEL